MPTFTDHCSTVSILYLLEGGKGFFAVIPRKTFLVRFGFVYWYIYGHTNLSNRPWTNKFSFISTKTPVHTNAFSFENTDISMRFGLPSTLKRSKTLSVFTENESEAKWKHIHIVLVWTVENGAFWKRWRQ